ncbi:alpha/beta fold hydrolase [Actinomadura alba]|uniref:Alpha/beta hydrolase n=1 Tax=Actinomadura alba TaxID=406431 RepID=A0ABR7LVB4_9ACTN|nr:alpha/beta hydrolase [Actinomadura alba]MBC6468701.1 alpha/beta hydrolase [Actinomadura alba]
MAMIKSNGVRFGCDDAGAGPVVVLVHAGCADRRMWEHQVTALSGRHRVIRYDWRGHGESADAVGDFAHHEDLLALLDSLEVQQAALVGCSDGGKIVLDAALTAPERVSSLTLVAAGLSGHTWPSSMLDLYRERVHSVIGLDRLRRYRAGAAGAVETADLDAHAAAETEFLVAGPGRSRADLAPEVWRLALDMDRLVNERMWTVPQAPGRPPTSPAKERLAEVGVPALVVIGSADVPEIQAASDLLAEGIKGARKVVLPDTGHLPPLERPEEFNAALIDFLDGSVT